jgi:hypothetical protein
MKKISTCIFNKSKTNSEFRLQRVTQKFFRV